MLGPDRKCFFFLSDSDLQIPISKNGLQLWRTALWLRQDCLLSNDRSDSLRVPKYMKNYFGFAHASSFPLYEGQLFYWSIMTAVDSIKCRCAHSGMTGQVDRFQNPGVSVSPSASFLSSPPPLRSFTCAIFRAVFDSRSSFFASKPHGNACYAGYERGHVRNFLHKTCVTL